MILSSYHVFFQNVHRTSEINVKLYKKLPEISHICCTYPISEIYRETSIKK